MLGIPMEMIKIKSTNTLTSANDQATGGSVTSELVCMVSRPCFIWLWHALCMYM